MKKFCLTAILLLAGSVAGFAGDAAGGKAAAAGKGKELTVLSWNIWHSGHAKEYPKKGCEGTQGLLKASKADVVLLIETYGSAPAVAKALGYDYRLLSSNLSIYSRYPILETYTFPKMIATFNFGGVMIDVNGQKVRVFDTWLHYLPDERLVPTSKSEKEILAWDDAGTRDEEVRAILKVLRPFLAESDKIPVIMGGDFNSHSHLDWTKQTRYLYNHGGAVVRWTVSTEMEKAGFIDSYRHVNPCPVTHPGVTWWWTGWKIDRQDRIDFIYYHGKGIDAVTSESHDGILGEPYLFRGKPYFYASDHGFVLTTFRFK